MWPKRKKPNIKIDGVLIGAVVDANTAKMFIRAVAPYTARNAIAGLIHHVVVGDIVLNKGEMK